MAESPDDVMVANESGCCEVDGLPTTFVAGVTRARRDHPLVQANPQFWTKVESRLTYEVEAATAEPGEKRGAKKPK